jgi:hypothetical protein
LVAAIVLILLAHCAAAQIEPVPISKPVPVPAPDQLLQQLMPVPAQDENCQTDASDKAQASALKALGISVGGYYSVKARLVYEDVDGDGVAEALLTVEIDSSDVVLMVLKRQGDQWYRLPSPSDFSCWCKYERSPLDSFVELRGWKGPGDEQTRLIVIRASGGGTGLYERSLAMFALHGLEIKSVFSVVEERRECDWPDGHCESKHVIIEEGKGSPQSLVAREIRDKRDEARLGSDESWWAGLPVSSCEGYAWNASDFKFVRNSEATAKNCAEVGPDSKSSKQQH